MQRSTDRWLLRLALASIAALANASMCSAQVHLAANDSVRVWASVSLGPGIGSTSQREAGVLSLWFTHRSLALGGRFAGISRVMDPGDTGDRSVMIGRRINMDRTTVVAAIGAGRSRAHDLQANPLPTLPVIVVGAEAIRTFRVVGVGLSAFGGFGSHRRYGGIGLTLALGYIR